MYHCKFNKKNTKENNGIKQYLPIIFNNICFIIRYSDFIILTNALYYCTYTYFNVDHKIFLITTIFYY